MIMRISSSYKNICNYMRSKHSSKVELQKNLHIRILSSEEQFQACRGGSCRPPSKGFVMGRLRSGKALHTSGLSCVLVELPHKAEGSAMARGSDKKVSQVQAIYQDARADG